MTADALAVAAEVVGKVVDLHTGEVVAQPAQAPAPITEAESRELLAGARRALEEAESLPAIASIVHRADVTRIAARKAKLSEEACLDWAEFSLDAQREAGRMLSSMPEVKRGGDQKSNGHGDRLTLDDIGVSHNQSKRWQAVASLPDEDYQAYKEKARAKGEITRAGAIKLAKQTHAAEAAAAPVIVPDGTFSTIVADPPWRYGNTSTRGAAEDHYPTMTIEELCDLGVARERAADQAHLYLWSTAGHLPEAFKVMEAWGFTYKTYLVWVKPQMGMGNYFRVSTELVLFGIRGDMRTQDMGIMNYFTAPRGKHSSKPQAFYDLVAKASPGPYLEMFSRCYKDTQVTCMCSHCLRDWTVWGNQA